MCQGVLISWSVVARVLWMPGLFLLGCSRVVARVFVDDWCVVARVF